MAGLTTHIATIAAYPIKESLGGGFRGVYKAIGQERIASPEAFKTLEQARYWAKNEAWTRHSEQAGYALAPLRRRGEYQANIWVEVKI